MTLRALHRTLGGIVSVFIIAHLGNHLRLFWGVEQHLPAQDVLRKIYRNRFVEPVLIAAFAVQLFIGLKLVLKRGWPKRWWSRVQTMSGGILALVLVQYITAVFVTRTFSVDVDTTIYWAASVVSGPPWSFYFIPYYGLGLAAIFLHVAAFIAFKTRSPITALAVSAIGIAFSLSFVVMLTGAFYAIDLPPAYLAYIDGFPF